MDITLYYFAIPARGEAIKLTLANANIPFKNVEVGFGEEFEKLVTSLPIPLGKVCSRASHPALTLGLAESCSVVVPVQRTPKTREVIANASLLKLY